MRRIIRRHDFPIWGPPEALGATVGGSWRLTLPGRSPQWRSAHTTHTRTFCPRRSCAFSSSSRLPYTNSASAIRKNLYISQRNVYSGAVLPTPVHEPRETLHPHAFRGPQVARLHTARVCAYSVSTRTWCTGRTESASRTYNDLLHNDRRLDHP